MPNIRVSLCPPASLQPAAAFGVGELSRALAARGHTVSSQGGDATIILALPGAPELAGMGLPTPQDRPESYAISRPAPQVLAVVGRDETGLMYGCLDLAEQLDMGRDLAATALRDASPELAVRGLYLFLHNEEAERGWANSPAFWQSYADELARCRYNRFNLVYGHQSPYLVPIYAFMLDDLDAEYPEIRVQGITADERARHLEALQLASAAMAGRGLAFTLGIWNSRPWKTANGIWEDQPTRVTGADDLARLAAYTRQGFTRLMERCPAISGIQLRMNIESGIADQRFFVQAFVPALQDLASRGRRLAVELRNWGLHPDTLEAFRRTGLEVIVSTKYFAEHQAMPYQPPAMRGSYSYDSFLRKDKPFPFQWQVWNLGSHRLFSWGDPDYARRLALSCHLGDGVGFEVTPPGSQKGFSQWGQVEGAAWQARSDLPPQWDHQRYWFFHLAFGRMGYDPATPDEVFLHQLSLRTTAAAAPALLAGYRAASKVVSYLISQRMDDLNMYVWPELDCGGPIDHNISAPPGEVTLFATAAEHARNLLVGRASAKRSPFDCARDLEGLAGAIEGHLASLAALPGIESNAEYEAVRVDFGALAALARFHAAKSRATGSLALFYATGERRWLDDAEDAAAAGIGLWDELCARTQAYHGRLHLGPSGGHWRDNRPRVQYDLRRIRRVRELFEAHGLFTHGYDLGPSPSPEEAPRVPSGLEPEPRFTAVDEQTTYSPERGHGWLRTAGLRAVGLPRLGADILWGVHYVRPGVEYDAAAVQRLPLDGLTQSFLTADEPRTFRVDLPDGEYELVLLAPAVAGLSTPVQVGAQAAELGGPAAATARLDVTVTGSALEVTLGGRGPWALAGLVIRPKAPLLAHLPAQALPAGEDAPITATATAPGRVRSLRLRWLAGDGWRETAMAGEGAAYQAVVPAGDLPRDALEYELLVEGTDGRTRRCGYSVPILHGFRPPRIVEASGPPSWTPCQELPFRVTLADGAGAREVRLHYREADQNRSFRVAALPGGRSGEYTFTVDARHLDAAYDLIYYFEVVDALGGGSFYPDPFREARYFVCPSAGGAGASAEAKHSPTDAVRVPSAGRQTLRPHALASAPVAGGDRAILRELAQRYLEACHRPVQLERRRLWRAHNSLRWTRPLIYVRAFAWREMPESRCACQDPVLRQYEQWFRYRLFWDSLDDDSIFEPWVDVQTTYKCTGWGISGERLRSDEAGGSVKIDYPIKEERDVEKMRAPWHEIDEQATAREASRLHDCLGDLITINVDRGPAYRLWTGGDIAICLGKLRGIEHFMLDMYDRPEWLHRLLAFMRDGILRTHEQAEAAGDWGRSSHQNQAMPYAEELPDPAPNVNGVKRSELWGYMAAQEYTLVSPAMHDEFLLRYQLPILRAFGLVAYGCCEDLTAKIDMLRQIPNLRRIAVAPVANVARCAEAIGRDYVLSYRPSPADMVAYGWDPERARAILHRDLTTCRDCHTDITLKDVETVQGDPGRVRAWVRLARQVIDEVYG